MSIRQVFWRALAVLVLTVLVSGCAPGTTACTQSATSTARPLPSPTPSAASGNNCDCAGPPPIILKDTSPGQLTLTLSLSIGSYEADATRDMIGLTVGFYHQGSLVQLVAGEHLSCNGLALASATFFHLQVPSETFSGKRSTCTYTSGKTSAPFTFTCPLAPAILSPQEYAQVARSRRTPVSYRISPDWAYYVIALGPHTKAWTPEAAAQPNPVMVDTSAFSPGPGFIAIHQFFTLTDLQAPGFHSVVDQGGSAVYEIQVTWV